MSYNPNVIDGKEWQYQKSEPSYDCGNRQYSCKPHSHQNHDVLCSDEHDAHYCYTCDHWVESVCADKKCKLCKNRPEKVRKNAD